MNSYALTWTLYFVGVIFIISDGIIGLFYYIDRENNVKIDSSSLKYILLCAKIKIKSS